MKAQDMKFDIYAMTNPKNRQDCLAIAYEILAEIHKIEAHIDAAIARCEAKACPA